MSDTHESTLAEALTTMAPELAAALVDAQGRVEWVGKDGYNKHQGYNYSTAEGMIAEGRAALNAAGLALMHSWRADRYPSAVAPEKGEVKLAIGRVVVAYLLIHKGGNVLSFETSTPVVPEKGRPEDKAEQASLTANMGYTMRGLLLIPRGEAPGDGIDDRDDDDGRAPSPQREQGPRQPSGQPPQVVSRAAQRAREDGKHEVAAMLDGALNTEVPFMSAEERAAAKTPVAVVADPWADVVAGACKSLDECGSVAALVAGLGASLSTLPCDEDAMARIKRHALRAIIVKATTRADLAHVAKLGNGLPGSEEWHAETKRLYLEKSAALGKVGQGKAT